MTNGSKMFLLAAKELNFSRAAERAFVIQQCLSDHIERLEEMYHITPFQRKPRLQLTPEGHTMLRYLSGIQALGDSMANELCDISEGVRGTINFGVSSIRGGIIIPKLVPQLQKDFPNVDVQIQPNDIKRLELQLINDKLDTFLGMDISQHVMFNRADVCEDSLYLIISDTLLRTYFSDTYETRMSEFPKGADLSLFKEVPFVQDYNTSTTTYVISQSLMKYDIELKIPISASNSDILIESCRTELYATTTSCFHLIRLTQMNRMLPNEMKMRVFFIKNLNRELNVEIITHCDAQPLLHMSTLVRMLKDFLIKENMEIERYLIRHSVSV